jgi:diadenosine tetraphosphate (Ap4A) HIT family hydrolase
MPDRFPCCFCECSHGRLRHSPVLETKHVVIEVNDCQRSVKPGAMLISPREHIETLAAAPTQLLRRLSDAVFTALSVVFNTYSPSGFHTFCSAGKTAGQSEAHLHFQIQPRYANEPYSFAPGRDLPTVILSERERIADELRSNLTRTLPDPTTLEEAIPFPRGDIWSCMSSQDSDLVLWTSQHCRVLVHPQHRSPGALLIVPRREVSCFLLLSNEERSDLFAQAAAAARSIEEYIQPDGLSVWFDTGVLADQAYRQMVVEVVPRFKTTRYRYVARRELTIAPRHACLSDASIHRRPQA